jgi:hypothetical protein
MQARNGFDHHIQILRKCQLCALPDPAQVERVIRLTSIVSPCGCGTWSASVNKTERLVSTPLPTIVTIRPKYTYPKRRAGVVRPGAHPLEGAGHLDYDT